MKRTWTLILLYLFIAPVIAGPVGFEPSFSGTVQTVPSSGQSGLASAFFAETKTPAVPAGGIPNPNVSAATKFAPDAPACLSEKLSDKESQNILDLLKNGFTGKEISGDTIKDKDRKKLDANELVLQKPGDDKSAVKTQVPSQKFKPKEISPFLNSRISGPFAFGLVLADSLRAGRCKDTSSADCTLTGPNLKYRNSGSGIVSDLKPIKEAMGELFYDKWLDGNQSITSFTKEENDALRESMKQNSDTNAKSSIKTAKRLQSQLIPNTILTNTFEARLQTNCNNSSCVISTYSLFDKYFNSWMSTDMVVSTFGPSLLYQTKKLFGWTGRRGFFSGIKQGYQEFLDLYRAKYATPESFLYNNLRGKINQRLNSHNEWKEWWQKGVAGNSDGSGYYFFKTEEFEDWWGAAQTHDGFLSHIKTQEDRAEFLRMLKDMRSFMRAGEANVKIKKDAYQKALALAGDAGLNDPVARQKYKEFGQEMIRYMDDYYDEGLGADYIEWINRYEYSGLFDKGFKMKQPDGSDEVFSFFRDHRNLRNILRKVKNDASFEGFDLPQYRNQFGGVYESRGDNLVLYTLDQPNAQLKGNLSYGNLTTQAPTGTRQQLWVKDDTGRAIPFNSSSAKYLQQRLSTGAGVLEGNWKEYGEISPIDMIARIDNGRTGSTGNLRMGVYNVQTMIDTLQERNWISRRYWSTLDKLAAQENELIRTYFTIQGGAKWTTLPFGYWWSKKGFGQEGLSLYQLPETWHDLKFTQGEEPVYDYAYVDLFANEGSDTGDIFVQMINNLPWKLVLDELSDRYNPVKNLYDSLTKNQIRSETENLAMYMTGPEDCPGCSVVITSQNMDDFKPAFFVENQQLMSYFVEDIQTEKARAKGQTLIFFGGHTNLVGQSGEDKGEPINLADAVRNEKEKDDKKAKTCRQAIEDLHFAGISWGKLYNGIMPDIRHKDSAIGGALAGLESITYGTFFWAGIFSTVAVQVAIAPQLHGCVDTEQGYYAHYFLPVKEVKDKQSGTTEKSTEKVSKLVQGFREKFVDSFKSDSNSTVKNAAEDLGSQIDTFTKDAKQNDILQATLRMEGTSSGELYSKELFYVWAGKESVISPVTYRTEGKEKISGNNDVNLSIDFEKGQISANGKTIVESPDNVRMATTNLGVPAIEIPKTLTQTCLHDLQENIFEINADGDVRVKNKEALDCLKRGVEEQTGLPLQSDKLNDVFGKLEAIVTDTHPNIRPMGQSIMAEGTPRKVAQGRSATVTIKANMDVNLSSSNDGETRLGKLQSLQFANGSIVVKPDGCFITWLRHHENGILNKDDVGGLKANMNREYNGETMCEEPTVNFELLPEAGSDLKKSRVDNFNKSLQHMGPYTVFETPTKRYVISAEKDESGKCRDHLRVIDKATGKVTDYVGDITQTPNGLKIKTDDGKEHELAFSEKDGAPLVQFDKDKPETLTAAQGKNGSFYYDPEKGLWFAENAQLLPLIEAFREGLAAKVAPNGEVTATAQGNVLNVDLGKKDDGLLNLPSLPDNRTLVFVLLSLTVFAFIYLQNRQQIKRKKK